MLISHRKRADSRSCHPRSRTPGWTLASRRRRHQQPLPRGQSGAVKSAPPLVQPGTPGSTHRGAAQVSHLVTIMRQHLADMVGAEAHPVVHRNGSVPTGHFRGTLAHPEASGERSVSGYHCIPSAAIVSIGRSPGPTFIDQIHILMGARRRTRVPVRFPGSPQAGCRHLSGSPLTGSGPSVAFRPTGWRSPGNVTGTRRTRVRVRFPGSA